MHSNSRSTVAKRSIDDSRQYAYRCAILVTIAAAALIWTMIAATPANAQVIVIKSTTKNLRAGSLLEGQSNVRIPKGASAVVVLPSGAMRTIAGPFEGTASDLAKGVKANPDLWKAVKRYAVTGGTNQKQVGAMRSAVAFRKPAPFSWNTVLVRSGGDFCVEKGANISLVRTHTSKMEVITIVDMKSKLRAQVVFEKGTKSVAWPEDLEIDPGTTYTAIIPGLNPREIRIRVIDPLPAREDILQVLHGQSCQRQFRAFIREMRVAAK